MANENLSELQLAAALAEEIYRRNDANIPIRLADLGAQGINVGELSTSIMENSLWTTVEAENSFYYQFYARLRSAARLAARAAIAIVMLLAGYNAALGQAFNPIRRLTTWYIDRSLVDIQITGSTSTLDDLHRLEPDRVLRLRLERAYVTHLLAEKGPGFESVNLSFDMETQLPYALILAANQPKQFRQEFAGIPKLSLEDWGRRRLSVNLTSTRSAASLRRVSDGLPPCKGEPEDGQLFAYLWEGRRGCYRPVFPNGSKHIARYDDWLLEIRCQGESFRGLGCRLRFPFEEFGVELAFHRSHLPSWRDVVNHASAFLKAKKYQ